MDMTILNIALPQMTAGLSPTSTQQLWIIDIYSLIQAGLLVSFAAIADCFGRKRMLMLGYSIFAVASLGVLNTETPEAVITIRALLGIGGAMIMPTTLSLIRVIFTSPRERATALSIWAAVSGLGAAVGPLFGGMLLEHFSWHVTRSVGNQNIRRRRKPSRARNRNSTVHRFCPARLVHYPVPAQQRTAPGHRIVPKPAILRRHHCRARVHFRHRWGIAAARTMDTDGWRSEPRSGWYSLIPRCNCERDCVTFRSPLARWIGARAVLGSITSVLYRAELTGSGLLTSAATADKRLVPEVLDSLGAAAAVSQQLSMPELLTSAGVAFTDSMQVAGIIGGGIMLLAAVLVFLLTPKGRDVSETAH